MTKLLAPLPYPFSLIPPTPPYGNCPFGLCVRESACFVFDPCITSVETLLYFIRFANMPIQHTFFTPDIVALNCEASIWFISGFSFSAKFL